MKSRELATALTVISGIHAQAEARPAATATSTASPGAPPDWPDLVTMPETNPWSRSRARPQKWNRILSKVATEIPAFSGTRK